MGVSMGSNEGRIQHISTIPKVLCALLLPM